METLQYNTKKTQLIIPEYGRHVQIMINQILETQDREERNKMAKAVIGVMGNMNPHLRDVPDFQHKLWDQLFIMSNFELDLDSPYEKPQKEVLAQKPERLAYPQRNPKYRFYGNNIKSMINVTSNWEDGDLKNALVYNIANHMKKCFLNWNKDTVQDEVILNHLSELSDNKLKVKEEDLPLTDSSEFLKIRHKNGNGSNKNNQKQRNKRNNGRKRY
ncbi:MAG: methionyl-tRNA formyltransferase [Flavobacteriaceae bacterium]|nr:methionyl-tRNA formyltransferase [Flavobacteriaceae bacterium]|tara:strand:+ start:890 stop:1537 length:648 start_codon:yes stop_codon:yes gene_type:complete